MLTTITSNPASPIRPIGLAVTLICTVVLSPLVDVPVTVAIYLSDPAGTPLTTTSPSVYGSTGPTVAQLWLAHLEKRNPDIILVSLVSALITHLLKTADQLLWP